MKLKFVNTNCLFEEDTAEYIVLKQGMPVPRKGDRVKLPDGGVALIKNVCFDYEKEIITLSFIQTEEIFLTKIPIIENFIKSKEQKGENTITEEEAKQLTKKLMDETEIILKEINRELDFNLN